MSNAIETMPTAQEGITRVLEKRYKSHAPAPIAPSRSLIDIVAELEPLNESIPPAVVGTDKQTTSSSELHVSKILSVNGTEVIKAQRKPDPFDNFEATVKGDNVS